MSCDLCYIFIIKFSHYVFLLLRTYPLKDSVSLPLAAVVATTAARQLFKLI